MLPKKYRLRKRKEIEEIFKKGNSKNSDLVFIKFLKNNLENPRFCFIVSKKISNKAVERNKVKRLLREVVRKEILPNLKTNCDYLIIAKPLILNKNYWQIKKDLEKGLVDEKNNKKSQTNSKYQISNIK